MAESGRVEDVLPVYRALIVKEEDLVSRTRLESLIQVAKGKGADPKVGHGVIQIKWCARSRSLDGLRNLYLQER
jgi:hypothetical protein